MTLAEIKAAVDAGKTVHWANEGYTVIKDSLGQYLIAWMRGTPRANYIGLTWRDGVTLNGKEEQFYLGTETRYTAKDLVLCESPDGWSLHAPGSTDEAIACGDARYIVTGTGKPTKADYDNAFRIWRNEQWKYT